MKKPNRQITVATLDPTVRGSRSVRAETYTYTQRDSGSESGQWIESLDWLTGLQREAVARILTTLEPGDVDSQAVDGKALCVAVFEQETSGNFPQFSAVFRVSTIQDAGRQIIERNMIPIRPFSAMDDESA